MKIYLHKNVTKLFIGYLFVIVPNWKQHICLSVGERLSKLWCIHCPAINELYYVQKPRQNSRELC